MSSAIVYNSISSHPLSMRVKKVCRAAYDFDGTNEGELNNVKDGDFLLILEDGSDDEWLTARHRSQDAFSDSITGLIPSNYVDDVSTVWD